MDARVSERNRIKARVREVSSFIKFNSNAIGRLRQASVNVEFCRNKIEKLKVDNQALSAELKALDERAERLSSGDLDNELRTHRRTETVLANKKTKEKRQKKLDEIADKEKRSVVSKQYWDRTIKAGREDRYAERSSKRGYNYVLRVQQSLPQYMRAKLADMPNNKGYVWRGIHYYGLKDPEKNTNFVMFENKKGELLIHEWSRDRLTYVLTRKRNKKERGEVDIIRRFKRNPANNRVLLSEEKPRPGTANPLKQRQRQYTPRNNNKRYSKKRTNNKERQLTPAEARRRSRGGSNSTQKQKMPRNNKKKRLDGAQGRGDQRRSVQGRGDQRRSVQGRGVQGRGDQRRSVQGRGDQRRSAQRRSAQRRSAQGRGVEGRGVQGRGVPVSAGRGKSRTLPAWMTKKE